MLLSPKTPMDLLSFFCFKAVGIFPRFLTAHARNRRVDNQGLEGGAGTPIGKFRKFQHNVRQRGPRLPFLFFNWALGRPGPPQTPEIEKRKKRETAS